MPAVLDILVCMHVGFPKRPSSSSQQSLRIDALPQCLQLTGSGRLRLQESIGYFRLEARIVHPTFSPSLRSLASQQAISSFVL
jgi:hypothetical protein